MIRPLEQIESGAQRGKHMNSQKKCPNDSSHDRFVTGAVVCQDWVVDGSGNFMEVFDECTQVFHKPSTDNEWTCADCGAVGVDNVAT
jgi:hypothetical protein